MVKRNSRHILSLLGMLLVVVALLAACTGTPAVSENTGDDAPAEEPESPAEEPVEEPIEEPAEVEEPTVLEANITEGCVEVYEEGVNYFPERITVDYAANFTVEYFDNYKVVNVLTPWPGATEEDALQYILVQCGTPAPEGYEDALTIEVPVQRSIIMSTTILPHVPALDILDEVVAVDTATWSNTQAIIDKQAAGELQEISDAFDPTNVNIELALELEPDVVLSYGSGFQDFDSYPILTDAGIPVVLNADHVESTPIGRAEWIKFTALFFNREAAANEAFTGTADAYTELVALTVEIAEEDKPLVLVNAYDSWSEAWVIPGSETFVGQMMADAGARLVLGDDPLTEAGSGFFDFESVYESGLDADIWLPNAFAWYTLDDVLTADPRHEDFIAFVNGEVYNNVGRVNAMGGNDLYESGASHPEIVLADLIKIFYPDLLPDHELVYYLQLLPAE